MLWWNFWSNIDPRSEQDRPGSWSDRSRIVRGIWSDREIVSWREISDPITFSQWSDRFWNRAQDMSRWGDSGARQGLVLFNAIIRWLLRIGNNWAWNKLMIFVALSFPSSLMYWIIWRVNCSLVPLSQCRFLQYAGAIIVYTNVPFLCKIFPWNMKIYLPLLSFLHISRCIVPVVEMFPCHMWNRAWFSCTVNTTVADVLVMEAARTSAATLSTQLPGIFQFQHQKALDLIPEVDWFV